MCNPNCPRAKPLIKHQLTKDPLPLHCAPLYLHWTAIICTLHWLVLHWWSAQCAVSYSAGVYPDSIWGTSHATTIITILNSLSLPSKFSGFPSEMETCQTVGKHPPWIIITNDQCEANLRISEQSNNYRGCWLLLKLTVNCTCGKTSGNYLFRQLENLEDKA